MDCQRIFVMACNVAGTWDGAGRSTLIFLRCQKTIMNKKILAPVLVAGTALFSGHVAAQQSDFGFSKRIYIGIGTGLSNLEPDTGAVDGLEVEDDTDVAGNVTLGFDFSRRMSAEIKYAELGTAGLTDGDGIEYVNASLSALYYLWNGFGSSDYLDYDGLDQRAGLSLYGRLGVGAIENEAVNSVEFERDSEAQVIAGLGIEYALAFGLGARAEIINYDSDAFYRGVSLLYRFGGGPLSDSGVSFPSSIPEPPAELPSLPEPQPEPQPVETLPLPEPLPTAAPEPSSTGSDSDVDGVADVFDNCPSTPPGTPVDSSGCAIFNGTLEGVNFLPGSDTLTDTSRVILDDVVTTLFEFPDVRVSVQAHTDNRGDEAANMLLSRNRALAVVRYLTAQGIPIERFEARAFGETLPIADNNTRAGRLLNRRVEFKIVR